MILDPQREHGSKSLDKNGNQRIKDKRKSNGVVGGYKLSSEDQKIIVSLNQIIPLID